MGARVGRAIEPTSRVVAPRDGRYDVERPLHALGQAPLFVDLADKEVLTPGAQYSLSALTMGIPARHYRALVFLETSLPYEDP